MTTATQQSFDNLMTMILYMDAQCAKINALVAEIEEIQGEFENRYVDTQQRFENARARIVVWVEQHDWQQPEWLAAEVAERLPEVTKAKRRRLDKLADEIRALEAQRQVVETQSQTRVNALKENNPRLNAREEELKRLQAETQAAMDERLEQWRRAAAGLGWLLRSGKVGRLRAEAQSLGERLNDLNSRLTEVRNAWATLESKTDESEDEAQRAWRLGTADIARLKREQHALQTDFDAAVREAAVEEILNAIAEVKPSGYDDFDRALAEMVKLHDATVDYQNGIAQVAELMGVMTGVCEGLQRMKESVASVKQEQDMHAELRDLRLEAPEFALEFHQLWDRLHPVVLDEKFAADHPRDLAHRLRATIGDRLSKTAIDSMFTSLGNELDRATKEQW